MHIDVNDILQRGEGYQNTYEVSGEAPLLEDVTLMEPISGTIRVIGTKDGVLAVGKLQTGVQLECHRCLQAFTYQLSFPLEAEFEDAPGEDQFPISKHGVIDLTEPVRQDIVVHLPLQQLCQDDCNGIKLTQEKESNGSSQETNLKAEEEQPS